MDWKNDSTKFFYNFTFMTDLLLFTHPGLNNSGPLHWQTRWEERYGFQRIQQEDWDTPVCEDWIVTLDRTLAPFPAENIILAGHSLACSTIAHWANRYGRRIKGALLVAPSDTEAPSYPPGTSGFSPMPLSLLPFPTLVVASSDDYYVTSERAAFFAEKWGAKLVNIGAKGHINTASNLGDWPEGYALLEELY